MPDKNTLLEKYTDAELLELIGSAIRRWRVEESLTQQELAEAAGINRSTLSMLENGSGTSAITLVQVMRVLGRLEVLSVFRKPVELSPMRVAEMEIMELKRRRRVRKKRKQTDDTARS